MLVTTLRRVVVTNCSPGATPGRTAALRALHGARSRASGPSFFGCGVRTRVGGTAEHFGTRGAAARGGRARGPAGSAALAFAERDPRGGCHGGGGACTMRPGHLRHTHRKQRHKWPRDIAAHPDDAHKVGSPEGACGDLANVTGSPGETGTRARGTASATLYSREDMRDEALSKAACHCFSHLTAHPQPG